MWKTENKICNSQKINLPLQYLLKIVSQSVLNSPPYFQFSNRFLEVITADMKYACYFITI